MKQYRVKKQVAIVQAALASADMIRAIAKADSPMDSPFIEGDEKYFRFSIQDKETGALFILDLPATEDYFDVEESDESRE